jgi:hypothetical protein
MEINGTTSTFSTGDSEISAAESQIAGESQTTISIPQSPQEPADSFMEPKNTQKRRRGFPVEAEGVSRKKKR